MDIIGDKYGRLTVLEEVEPYWNPSRTYKTRKFLCKCECGNKLEIVMSSLRSGKTKSCGCYNRDTTIKRNIKMSKYGKYSKNKHFSRWKGMNERCYYPKHKDYHSYGGRGITVCEEWREHPKEFIEWVENESNYKKGLSLDRINNDGNYEPSNCNFSTAVEQALNRNIMSSNTSGYSGVTKHTNNRWRARINVNKKRISLGVYATKEEAINARKEAETKYFGKILYP